MFCFRIQLVGRFFVIFLNNHIRRNELYSFYLAAKHPYQIVEWREYINIVKTRELIRDYEIVVTVSLKGRQVNLRLGRQFSSPKFILRFYSYIYNYSRPVLCERTRRKIMSQCHFCHRKSYKAWPGFERGLFDDRKALAAWSMEWSHVEEKEEKEKKEEREEKDKKNKSNFQFPAFSNS